MTGTLELLMALSESLKILLLVFGISIARCDQVL